MLEHDASYDAEKGPCTPLCGAFVGIVLLQVGDGRYVKRRAQPSWLTRPRPAAGPVLGLHCGPMLLLPPASCPARVAASSAPPSRASVTSCGQAQGALRRLEDRAAAVTHTAPRPSRPLLPRRQLLYCCASTDDFPSAKEIYADLRRKDALLEEAHALVHAKDAQIASLQASAVQLEKKNAKALRLAGVVSVRSALDVILQDALPAKGEAAFVELLQCQLGAQALACCNSNAKIAADNGNKPHTVATLAFHAILKRHHKDTHVGKTAQAYIDSDDFLVLSSNGLSTSVVAALACLFQAHRYPVLIEGT